MRGVDMGSKSEMGVGEWMEDEKVREGRDRGERKTKEREMRVGVD